MTCVAVPNDKADSLSQLQQKAFVAALRELIRNRYDDNQHKAADALGFSQPYLSQLLSMKRSPGIAILLRISGLTGISLDELVGRPPSRPALAAVTQEQIDAHVEAKVDAKVRAIVDRQLAEIRKELAQLTAAPSTEAPPPPPSRPRPRGAGRRRSG